MQAKFLAFSKSKPYSLHMANAAIFTGDLIGSSKAETDQVDQSIAALAAASRKIAEWSGSDTRFTRFRGDGWQAYLGNPGLVCRAMLLFMATLKSAGGGLSTRMSIAVGKVNRLGEMGLSDAAGPALTLSGRNLDRSMTFSNLVYAEPEAKGFWKPAILDLAHWQASRWSREQAEAVCLALDLPRPPDADLARHLGISRQALQARLKGSGLMATSNALTAFEIESDISGV